MYQHITNLKLWLSKNTHHDALTEKNYMYEAYNIQPNL